MNKRREAVFFLFVVLCVGVACGDAGGSASDGGIVPDATAEELVPGDDSSLPPSDTLPEDRIPADSKAEVSGDASGELNPTDVVDVPAEEVQADIVEELPLPEEVAPPEAETEEVSLSVAIEIPFTSNQGQPPTAAWEDGCVDTAWEPPWLQADFDCPCEIALFGNPVVKNWGGTLDLSDELAKQCLLSFHVTGKNTLALTVKLKGEDAADPAENQSPDVTMWQYYDPDLNVVSIPLAAFEGENYAGKTLSFNVVRQVIFGAWQCTEPDPSIGIQFPLEILCPDEV